MIHKKKELKVVIPPVKHPAANSGVNRPQVQFSKSRNNPGKRTENNHAPRFGDGGLMACLIIGGVATTVIGGLGTLAYSHDSKWGMTRQNLNTFIEHLKNERVELIEKPKVVEEGGQIGKRYKMKIGDIEFVITEFKESKDKGKGFLSKPHDLLSRFRMEGTRVLINGTGVKVGEAKVKLIYDASVEGDGAGKPSKFVSYIDHFGQYETRKPDSLIVKKVQQLIKQLQYLDGEKSITSFFDKEEERTAVGAQSSQLLDEKRLGADTKPDETDVVDHKTVHN